MFKFFHKPVKYSHHDSICKHCIQLSNSYMHDVSNVQLTTLPKALEKRNINFCAFASTVVEKFQCISYRMVNFIYITYSFTIITYSLSKILLIEYLSSYMYEYYELYIDEICLFSREQMALLSSS